MDMAIGINERRTSSGIMPRISTPSIRRVLGLDPALRTLGWAKLNQTENLLVPIELGLIKTADVDDLSASQSNFVAGQDLYAAVRDLIADEHGNRLVDEIRAESMSYPPGASSAAKISICWGVLATITREYGIPLKQAAPQDIRKALQLPDRSLPRQKREKRPKGSPKEPRRKRTSKEKEQIKDDVLHAMEARFGVQTLIFLLDCAGLTKKADKRHPIDALAAAVAIR
jgi:Holliday junction resolvasome RuvABC endonuclease subunit